MHQSVRLHSAIPPFVYFFENLIFIFRLFEVNNSLIIAMTCMAAKGFTYLKMVNVEFFCHFVCLGNIGVPLCVSE